MVHRSPNHKKSHLLINSWTISKVPQAHRWPWVLQGHLSNISPNAFLCGGKSGIEKKRENQTWMSRCPAWVHQEEPITSAMASSMWIMSVLIFIPHWSLWGHADPALPPILSNHRPTAASPSTHWNWFASVRHNWLSTLAEMGLLSERWHLVWMASKLKHGHFNWCVRPLDTSWWTVSWFWKIYDGLRPLPWYI